MNIFKKQKDAKRENAGFLIPDLVDVYTPGLVYAWYRPVYQLGAGTGDFNMQTCDIQSFGDMPEWYGEGWDEGFADTYLGNGKSWRCETPIADYCMLHGIAPFQPALFEVHAPECYRTSYEYNEWDCEYNADFCRVLPIPQELTLRRWKRYLDYHKAMNSMGSGKWVGTSTGK